MKALFIIIMLVISFGLMNCQDKTANENLSAPTSLVNQEQAIFLNINADECKTLIENNEEVQLVDVRTSKECAGGMLSNAKQIDIYSSNFKEKIGQLKKDKPVIIYCAAGGRSKQAANYLKSLGYNEVYNLKGGIKSWKAKGFSIN